MTIELRPPRPGEEPQLRALFTEAFGDADFTDLFFRTGFSPDRCLVAADGELLAAQHWFDGTLDGKKAAYLYGIAAFQKHRGKGFGSSFLDFVWERYRSRVVRIRLEAEPENERAMAVYRKAGYDILGYTQLVCEL